MKNELQRQRKAAGLTQAQLAKLAGITERGIRRYETDETSKSYREPKISTALRIARILNTTVEKIWGETPAT